VQKGVPDGEYVGAGIALETVLARPVIIAIVLTDVSDAEMDALPNQGVQIFLPPWAVFQ
jgi:hypothetical protein